MPTYDYKCINCNYTFEYFQKITDELLTECPQCKGPLKRLIGIGAAPIFKGTGFYQTDYKNNSSDNKGKKENSSGKSKNKEPKAAANTESKPTTEKEK